MANQNLKTVLKLCRTIGMVGGILPASFPAAHLIRLDTVSKKKADWAGYGGADHKGRPFIAVNLAHNHSLSDMIATVSHEMLHIKQHFCDNVIAHHGNGFRADCKKFAVLLGVTYYHLNGYDYPSTRTAIAQAKKKIAKIRKHHADKKSGKWKQVEQ